MQTIEVQLFNYVNYIICNESVATFRPRPELFYIKLCGCVLGLSIYPILVSVIDPI